MEDTIILAKSNEKVLIWLFRENKTQQWLAAQLGITRQAISQKISDNIFSVSDIMHLRRLGCRL